MDYTTHCHYTHLLSHPRTKNETKAKNQTLYSFSEMERSKLKTHKNPKLDSVTGTIAYSRRITWPYPLNLVYGQ